MPINCDEVLSKMVSSAPEEAENIDKQVEGIEEIQDELEAQNQAIRECVTDKARDDLLAYLQGPKLAELQVLYPNVYFVQGPTYGSIGYGTGNITDWEFREDLPIPPPPAPAPDPSYIVVFTYIPGVDAQIDEYVQDYAFGNDYITHPIGIGASYGLEPLVDMYEQGKATLLANKAKIEQSIGVLSKYIS